MLCGLLSWFVGTEDGKQMRTRMGEQQRLLTANAKTRFSKFTRSATPVQDQSAYNRL